MTKEQFKKAIDDRESQIKNLQLEVRDLKERYVEENAKFEVGEKVAVIETLWNDTIRTHVAFITKIYTISGEINYWFNKSKKDGTISSKKLYVWSNRVEVKKLNSEQNPERSVATGLNQGTKAK